MTKFTMTVDVDKCTGCYACFLACRDEFKGNDYLPHSAAQPDSGQNWIRVEETERGSFPKVKISYTPIMCQQCEDAPCIDAASDGVVYRNEEGIVLIDPEKAQGQKAIAESCPYGVIFWNEEKNLAQKCTFCSHLLSKDEQPRCFEACPVSAIQFGDLDDANSAVSKARAAGADEQLNPEFGLNPVVSYASLPKKFITGEVVIKNGDTEECLAGVGVVLKGSEQEQSTVTDTFGDFEFDGLTADTDYTLIISADGHPPIEQTVTTESDVNLGVIELG
tara:strand:- start:2003 stop:2833 length:831 start_codon:yes stop_codon:yes gene_type:complete